MRNWLSLLFFGMLISCSIGAEEALSDQNLTAQQEVLELVHSPIDQLSPEFLGKLIRLFQVNIFVETRTYLGETSSQCAKLFKDVYTIESDHKLFVKAKKRFKNVPNIHCLEGEAENVLKKTLPKVHGKILFWLVSHHRYSAEPEIVSAIIQKELSAIRETQIKDSIILINDIQFFPKESSNEKILSIHQLQTLLSKINPSYRLWILGDVAIAIPNDSMPVSPLVKACTWNSTFSENDSIERVLEVEKTLMRGLSPSETKILDGLHEVYSAHKRAQEDPFACYIVWKGLALLGQQEYFEASRCFHSAIAKGFNHWRVYWYMAQSEYERRNLEEAEKALQKVRRDAPEFKEAIDLAEKIKQKTL